jgi:carnitine monooxygenase subunit
MTVLKRRFDPDPERSFTLPGSYYFDASVFDREKKEIFFKTWQFVGYLSDLGHVGDYLTGRILDQPVFIVRDKERKLRAYYNVCSHRGHILLEGKGSTRAIRCPFHAWTYRLDGSLMAAPYAKSVSGFDFSELCLPEIRVEVFANMAFVNLDPNAHSLRSQAQGLEEEFRRAIPNFDKLILARRDEFHLKCNWKFIFDGLECYHCPYIHPQAMGSENSLFSTSFDSHESEIYSTHIARGNRELIEKHPEKLPYAIGPGDLVDDHIWYLWPNMIFIANPGPMNFHVTQAMPTGPETSYRLVDRFFLNDPPNAANVAQMDGHRDVLAPQDIKAMEMQQLGVHALGYRQGRLMVDKERSWWSEHGVHHFNKLVWVALNGERYD